MSTLAILVDLDHTVVHTSATLCPDAEHAVLYNGFYTYIRPYVREFLSFLIALRPHVKIGFWTAGTKEYAELIVEHLLSLVNATTLDIDLLWSRDDTDLMQGHIIKRMEKAEKALGVDRAFLLDDNHEHEPYNVHRFLPVSKYSVENHETDTFLYEFMHFTSILLQRSKRFKPDDAIRSTRSRQTTKRPATRTQ